MAAPHASGSPAVTLDTLITIKVSVNDEHKKLKLPLRDLGLTALPDKLRYVLDIKPHQHMTLERYSDSSGGYITLDNAQVFKTLIRAAKAKLKLRLKATVTPVEAAKVEVEEEKDMNPVIVRSTADAPTMAAPTMAAPTMAARPRSGREPSRKSMALDQRSVGTGIFQFKEARASQPIYVNEDAPVPRSFFDDGIPAPASDLPASKPELVFRPRETPVVPIVTHGNAWSVYCNECDSPMADAHFHCSICDSGDYDLCEECVGKGALCPGEDHWLVKRFIQDGKVVNSTTERIVPKSKTAPTVIQAEPVDVKEMPGSFTTETKTLAEEPRVATRTCNSCVVVLPEHQFVHCKVCEDFDLCISCHSKDQHGHHPAHAFMPATQDTKLSSVAHQKLAPGRGARHNAICDGCDSKIFGVRHKCLNCPDWDYCSECVESAGTTHPHHRFAALYEPIGAHSAIPVRHYGIFCDGPLCSKKNAAVYIHGVRYKCTICHDTDFCASCEAAPGNHHNRTHPLLKLKTPIRNVTVLAENENRTTGNVRVMGDRAATKSAATETSPMPQANAATQVQTVAEIKPTEVKAVAPVKPAASKPIDIGVPVKKFVEKAVPASDIQTTLLNANFVRDSIIDGQVFEPEVRFTQIWTLKNPGPFAWPAGCSVRYIGGDNMLNVDNSHPASVAAINDATESNVVGREVAAGEEIAFVITLKAPRREGRSISYWRLKAPNGTPFGHRLWCDIQVNKAEPEVLASSSSGYANTTDAQMIALRRQAAELETSLKANNEWSKRPDFVHPYPYQSLKANNEWSKRTESAQPYPYQPTNYTYAPQMPRTGPLPDFAKMPPMQPWDLPYSQSATERIAEFQKQQPESQKQYLAEAHASWAAMRQREGLSADPHVRPVPESHAAMVAAHDDLVDQATREAQRQQNPKASDAHLDHLTKFNRPFVGFRGMKPTEMPMRSRRGVPTDWSDAQQEAVEGEQREAVKQQRVSQIKAKMQENRLVRERIAADAERDRVAAMQNFQTSRKAAKEKAKREEHAALKEVDAGHEAEYKKVLAIIDAHCKRTEEELAAKQKMNARPGADLFKIMATVHAAPALAVAEASPAADVPTVVAAPPSTTTDADFAKNEAVLNPAPEFVAAADDEPLARSQMVFPKLDKESPASSTYQSMIASGSAMGKAAYVENEAGEVEAAAVPAVVVEAAAPVAVTDDEDEFESVVDEDLEVLSASGESDGEEDGFVTDEEYDILDASDTETVASKLPGETAEWRTRDCC